MVSDDPSQGIGAPLRYPVFRKIWAASVLSNLGIMIQSVGAAWSMMIMTNAADKVALVQTATMLPYMLLAVIAGAIADMFDRRLVGIVALYIALAGAASLAALEALHLATPIVLLLFCFIIGGGMTLFSPAWQASVSEQVPAESLPAAVALNSISYNIARSFGPAIGGFIVAAVGAIGAFVANALLYLPLLVVLHGWQRKKETPRLPAERLFRAVTSGIRYVFHSPAIRTVLGRTFWLGLAGSSASALMPLIARDLLGGGAKTFGLMLGAYGIGAVLGALNIAIIRRRLSSEAIVRWCGAGMAVAIVVVAISSLFVVTALALVVAGACWMISSALFNVAVQMVAPRWVAGRALASYQTALAGGIALGSWGWGHVAEAAGVSTSLMVSALLVALIIPLGFWLRVPETESLTAIEAEEIAMPEVRLQITPRSGPIVIELDYRVPKDKARAFYTVMQEIQGIRQRNGGYDWSIARDVADPERWTERYHCPTWLDYLRQRNRPTAYEREIQDRASLFHTGDGPVQVRRMLERPFGSVRWLDEVPDRARAESSAMTPYGGA